MIAASPDTTTWQSDIAVKAMPAEVLDALTDVESCAAWSPVGFHVEDLDSGRLRAGTRMHVTGSLVGKRVRFAVEIFEASSTRLALRATGPIEMVADYSVRPQARSSRVDAAISIRPAPGLRGAIIGRATTALLSAGALRHTLVRLAREAERRAPSACAGTTRAPASASPSPSVDACLGAAGAVVRTPSTAPVAHPHDRPSRFRQTQWSPNQRICAMNRPASARRTRHPTKGATQ